MGARFSCFSGAIGAAVILDWEGNLLRRMKVPASAAELMLESPGLLVAAAEEIRRTRKAAAMGADEELRPGGVYVMVPAGRAGARISDVLLEAVEGAARRRKGRGKARVAAVKPEREAEGQRWELEVAELGFPGCRLRIETGWRPVLDGIRE